MNIPEIRLYGNFDGKNQMVYCEPMEVYDNKLGFSYPNFLHYDGEVEELKVTRFSDWYDKNGVKVWEGDIIQAKGKDVLLYGDKSPVVLSRGAFCYTLQYDLEDVPLWYCDTMYQAHLHYPNQMHFCEWLKEFEVIGNIYENPELIPNLQ